MKIRLGGDIMDKGKYLTPYRESNYDSSAVQPVI
jgi:hypothetical protein